MRFVSRALGAKLMFGTGRLVTVMLVPIMFMTMLGISVLIDAAGAEGLLAQHLETGAVLAQVPTSLPPPAPTPRPTEISDAKACPRLERRVPPSAIDAALANPNKVGGYNRLRDENKPASPMNPRQVYLSLLNPSVPYHPLFNPLHFRAGCP